MPTDRPPTTPTATDRASERGAAMIEFALLLPLLVMLVFGIITFGRAYFAKVELASAVREGARAAALGKSNGDAVAATVTAGSGLGIGSGNVQVLASCPPGADTAARVRATYDFTYNIPLVSSGTKTLTATGTMRCGV
jgi:Flp pilus assembly protein TadG